MSPELIDLLRCPETGQRLAMAPPEIIETIEGQRRAGTLKISASQPQLNFDEPIEGALLREDGRECYPIQHGIPLLLPGHTLVAH